MKTSKNMLSLTNLAIGETFLFEKEPYMLTDSISADGKYIAVNLQYGESAWFKPSQKVEIIKLAFGKVIELKNCLIIEPDSYRELKYP